MDNQGALLTITDQSDVTIKELKHVTISTMHHLHFNDSHSTLFPLFELINNGIYSVLKNLFGLIEVISVVSVISVWEGLSIDSFSLAPPSVRLNLW